MRQTRLVRKQATYLQGRMLAIFANAYVQTEQSSHARIHMVQQRVVVLNGYQSLQNAEIRSIW